MTYLDYASNREQVALAKEKRAAKRAGRKDAAYRQRIARKLGSYMAINLKTGEVACVHTDKAVHGLDAFWFSVGDIIRAIVTARATGVQSSERALTSHPASLMFGLNDEGMGRLPRKAVRPMLERLVELNVARWEEFIVPGTGKVSRRFEINPVAADIVSEHPHFRLMLELDWN